MAAHGTVTAGAAWTLHCPAKTRSRVPATNVTPAIRDTRLARLHSRLCAGCFYFISALNRRRRRQALEFQSGRGISRGLAPGWLQSASGRRHALVPPAWLESLLELQVPDGVWEGVAVRGARPWTACLPLGPCARSGQQPVRTRLAWRVPVGFWGKIIGMFRPFGSASPFFANWE